jgi:hypothetical protein
VLFRKPAHGLDRRVAGDDQELAWMLMSVMLIAALGAAPASAHERVESTRITIKANPNPVKQGKKVTFQGKLKSDWSKCFNWRPVKLYKGKQIVASKKTRKSGFYKFTVRVASEKTWRVKFAGRSWGKHPHVHRCLSSSSKGIRVRTR